MRYAEILDEIGRAPTWCNRKRKRLISGQSRIVTTLELEPEKLMRARTLSNGLGGGGGGRRSRTSSNKRRTITAESSDDEFLVDTVLEEVIVVEDESAGTTTEEVFLTPTDEFRGLQTTKL